jgi:hypothetical protein
MPVKTSPAIGVEVFVLQHVHELSDGCEDVKLLGIYSTEKAAKKVMAALAKRPGFSECPEGFHVEGFKLGATEWVDGFVTVYAGKPRKRKSRSKARSPGSASQKSSRGQR